MKTPIIVCENGEFLVFDSDGNTINLEVFQERANGIFGLLGGKIKKVKIKSESFIPENADVLHLQLTNFLLNLNPYIELSNPVSINELIDKIKKG